MDHGYNYVKFTATNPIKFDCKNFATLIDSMQPNDVKEFDFDVRKINWKQYVEDYFVGARKYLWNSKSTDYSAGRRKIMR
jgi:fatty acyl-CoA reductase